MAAVTVSAVAVVTQGKWYCTDIAPNEFLANQNGDAITISDLNGVLCEIDTTAMFCKFSER